MIKQQSLVKNSRVHVAIMKTGWGLTQKILKGEKTIDSRWYKNKYSPWDKIMSGDIIYFKDSGDPVTLKAKVTRVDQYVIANKAQALEVIGRYSKKDLGITDIMDEIMEYVTGKNYAIFIHLGNVKKIKPFDIDKTGFGAMSSWLIVKDINEVKK